MYTLEKSNSTKIHLSVKNEWNFFQEQKLENLKKLALGLELLSNQDF